MANLCILLIASFLICYCSSEAIHYVAPNESLSTQCPDHPCHTLQYYVEHGNNYFQLAPDNTFHFLSGIHILRADEIVLIYNVTNFVFLGSGSRSVIECLGATGFYFMYTSNVTIANLTFLSCGGTIPNMPLYSATIAFGWAFDVNILEITVMNGTGYGLLGLDIMGNSSIAGSSFISNGINKNQTYRNRAGYYVDGQVWGGNVQLRFVHRNCQNDNSSYSLDIESSEFLYGYGGQFGAGLSILMVQICYRMQINIRRIKCLHNNGTIGGNVFILAGRDTLHNTVTIEESIIAHGRSLDYGGGVAFANYLAVSPCSDVKAEEQTILRLINTHIYSNTALNGGGGGVSIALAQSCYKTHVYIDNVTLSENVALHASNLFVGSKRALDPVLKFYHSIQMENSVVEHGIARSALGAVMVRDMNNFTVANCRFQQNQNTALLAISSNIFFQSNNTFIGNTGVDGGAIGLSSDSFLLLRNHTHIRFINNHAEHAGGAIYVQDNYYIAPLVPPCFFQVEIIPALSDSSPVSGFSILNDLEISLEFENNSAAYAGSDVYGGFVDLCFISGQGILDNIRYIFNHWFQITERGPSSVSSNPLGVCLCDGNNHPNCSMKLYETPPVYPGLAFEISAVSVGQRNGIVPGVIKAKFQLKSNSSVPYLGEFQDSQSVENACTILNYTVFSSSRSEIIILTPATPRPLYITKLVALLNELDPPSIVVDLRPCPLGFMLNNSRCECASTLQMHNIECNIVTQTIHRTSGQWIGYDNTSINGTSDDGIIVHNHCPFDHCKQEDTNIRLEDLDKQCASNHSGVLCGACQPGLSLALGTSYCLDCTNVYLLLVAAFALAGLGLIFLLTFCNLTVAEGTINGLIFYANIVHTNRAIFLPTGKINVLTVFIAWFNLDLGIQTCFYDGLDAYAMTWLQFAFPIYLSMIVGVMIVTSRQYTVAARIFGTANAPRALATLFLLSYAKIQRTIITITSFTFLTYPNGTDIPVWLSDGNVPYLSVKHIPLFITGILALVCLAIPYTIVLVCIQFLLKTHTRCLRWIRRLKPVLDAYTGPYKDKYRFWTGLLLIVRSILFVIFAFNVLGDPTVNLLAIALTSYCLCMLAFLAVYKNSFLTILESLFFLNLGSLSVTTIYVRQIGGNQGAVTYTFVSVAFVTFVGIMLYHTQKSIKNHHVWKNMSGWVAQFRRSHRTQMELASIAAINNSSESSDESDPDPDLEAVVQHWRLTFEDDELVLKETA